MIYSSIYAGNDWSMYPDAIKRALSYIKEHDIRGMEPGKYEIEGDKMYILVQNPTQKAIEDTHLEMHYKYLDLQYIVDGGELMGFAPKKVDPEIIEAKESSDTYYVADVEDEQFVVLNPGDFCILFPNDLHRPAIEVPAEEPAPYHKAVVKISMDLF